VGESPKSRRHQEARRGGERVRLMIITPGGPSSSFSRGIKEGKLKPKLTFREGDGTHKSGGEGIRDHRNNSRTPQRGKEPS